MTKGSLYFYFREYYIINRRVWPTMSRRAACVAALKLAVKVVRSA